MPRSSKWIYKTKRRRRGGKAIVAALCLLAACGAFFAVMHIYDGWPEKPEPETEAATTEPPSETAPAEEPAQPIKIPTVKVKGLYVTAWSAGMEDRMAHYIELCDTTEINTLVIDVKDDRGNITFLNAIPGAAQASDNIIPDIGKTMARLKAHGIYTVARLSCFKDPLWSGLHPEQALQNARGAPWRDADGITWLNPYNKDSWAYIAAVAKEAARIGFDEVQLDYVRFPTGGRLDAIDFAGADAAQSKAEVIGEFLRYIREALADTKVCLSADVFGITAMHRGDHENIGQDVDVMARNADMLSLMLYPSHFANKRQNGQGQIIGETLFPAPDTQPYEVIYNSLIMIKYRVPQDGKRAGMRPYLQDFTASYLGSGYYLTYTAQQVREQIQAVYDAGFEEWILWNASGAYTEDALLPQASN